MIKEGQNFKNTFIMWEDIIISAEDETFYIYCIINMIKCYCALHFKILQILPEHNVFKKLMNTQHDQYLPTFMEFSWTKIAY